MAKRLRCASGHQIASRSSKAPPHQSRIAAFSSASSLLTPQVPLVPVRPWSLSDLRSPDPVVRHEPVARRHDDGRERAGVHHGVVLDEPFRLRTYAMTA